MTYSHTSSLSMVGIVAMVRNDGAIGRFERRTFELMLDQRDTQPAQLREARRILHQIGYQTRGVNFEQVPGN